MVIFRYIFFRQFQMPSCVLLLHLVPKFNGSWLKIVELNKSGYHTKLDDVNLIPPPDQG